MINLRDCLAMDCSRSLTWRHKEHLKEENRKNKAVKHVCTEACHIKEKEEHQKVHDWYLTQK